MPNLQDRQGIVGVFDILGYKNFLKNNPTRGTKSAARQVLTILSELQETEVPKIVQSIKPTRESAEQKKAVKRLLAATDWIVLSDTIVLTTALRGNEASCEAGLLWQSFLLQSIFLYRRMFDEGLPVRGAIACGDFIVSKADSVIAFAGMPIVEAYECAQQLNLSAVVVTKGGGDPTSAESKVRDQMNDDWRAKGVAAMVREYRVPLNKNCTCEVSLVLSPKLPKGYENKYTSLCGCIPCYVNEMFSKNNKPISKDDPKVLNTINFLSDSAEWQPPARRHP